MRCPACDHALRVESQHGAHAILRCACRDFPVIDGVLLADSGDLQTNALEAIRAGDSRRASRLILGSHARKARILQALGIRPTYERFVRHRILSSTLDRLRLHRTIEKLPLKRISGRLLAAAQWNVYARHRFAQATMLSNIALLGLLQGREGYVLDAPCGMGHLSFLINKLIPAQRLVCMDLSSAFVYSARRFFVPDVGAAIAHNMNDALPLADAQFGLVMCSDAFHYVENRQEQAREFMRITRDDGIVVLAHVHNRLHRTRYAGYPLSPQEYADLFKGCQVRIVPEREVFNAYVQDQVLDLSKPYAARDAESSPMLHVVASKSADAFRPVAPVRQTMIDKATNPQVNAMYRMQRWGGKIRFELRMPDGLRQDYEAYPPFLSEEVVVDASQVMEKNGQLQFADQQELLRQHVLLDLPRDY